MNIGLKTNFKNVKLMIASLFHNEYAILEKWCHQSIGVLDTHLALKFQIFHSISLLVIWLYDFLYLSKTGNYVITWRVGKIFNRKPQLVGGGEIWATIYPKSAFETGLLPTPTKSSTNIQRNSCII